MEQASAEDQRAAGTQLAELVRTKYNSRWNRSDLVERRQGGRVHMSAIARILAAHLRDHPRASMPADRDIESSQLRSLVSRALRGKVLGAETLTLFIDALNIERADADQLWRLWRGENDQIVVGDLDAPLDVPGYQPRRHDTLILHEHHWVGRERSPVRHRTLITVRARVDNLDRYQYRFDTPSASIRSVRGGEVGDIAQIGEHMWAADLVFRRPLARGRTLDLEFWTLLNYLEPPDPSLRRATHERIENVDLRVTFDPACLPASVHRARWQHYAPGRDMIFIEAAEELDRENSVDRYLRAVDRAVVGFAWQW